MASSGKDVDKLIADAEALLNMASGGARRAAAPPAIPVSQQSIDEMAALGYVCDESGCVLVLPTESIDDAAGARGEERSGCGWGEHGARAQRGPPGAAVPPSPATACPAPRHPSARPPLLTPFMPPGPTLGFFLEGGGWGVGVAP